jgi:hypothetical protein
LGQIQPANLKYQTEGFLSLNLIITNPWVREKLTVHQCPEREREREREKERERPIGRPRLI